MADASTGTPPVLISDPTAQANLPSTSSSLELLNPKRSRDKFEDGNAPPAEGKHIDDAEVIMALWIDFAPSCLVVDASKRARLDPNQGNLP